MAAATNKRQIIKENGKNAHLVEQSLPSKSLVAFRQITSVKPGIDACRRQHRFGGSSQAEMASWDRPDEKSKEKGTIEKAHPKGQKQQKEQQKKNSSTTSSIGFYSSKISNRPISNYLTKESSMVEEKAPEEKQEIFKNKMIENQKLVSIEENGGNSTIQNGIGKQNGKGEYEGLILYYQRSRSQSPPWLGPKKKRCAPKLNTQERLFGSPLPETPKKKVIEKHRSTIFDTSAPSSPSRTPKKCVEPSILAELTRKAKAVFQAQPVLLELVPPLVICGDIHAQYNDLRRIFSQLGQPPTTRYIFLGDYVDRGPQNLETIVLLLCYKVKYPACFYLVRGNHETSPVNAIYGFKSELEQRYGQRDNIGLFWMFNDAFAQMPCSALIGDRILCMHGGLSPALTERDQLRLIKRGWQDPQGFNNAGAAMHVDVMLGCSFSQFWPIDTPQPSGHKKPTSIATSMPVSSRYVPSTAANKPPSTTSVPSTTANKPPTPIPSSNVGAKPSFHVKPTAPVKLLASSRYTSSAAVPASKPTSSSYATSSRRICTMNVCVPEICYSSDQCPTNWNCARIMKCLKSCQIIDECKIGWICSNNEKVCVQEGCRCRSGESCVRGRCIPGWIASRLDFD
uniref:Serine/threonine-protein phosphatase n=1 Tax=Meloidogyne floridensis TaxID=298350 RepID=A0A915P7T2_9BILA